MSQRWMSCCFQLHNESYVNFEWKYIPPKKKIIKLFFLLFGFILFSLQTYRWIYQVERYEQFE